MKAGPVYMYAQRMMTTCRLARSALALCLLVATWVVGHPGAAWAAEEPQLKDSRFGLGIGAGFMRFDTSFKFTEKSSGRSVFVDSEGSLGLPEEDTIGIVFGRYRFSEKHAIGFSTFRVRRENRLLDGQATLGDYTITGRATLTDRTNFYYLNYTYTFMQDERTRVFGAFGLYGVDLTYALDLFGTIEYQGNPLPDQAYSASASAFAPLPMFGLDAVFALTPRWWFGTRVTLVAGSYEDITSASVLDTAVRAGYRFVEHAGIIFGLEYFSADLTIEDTEFDTDISYRYDGFFVGLHLSF